MSGLQKNGHIGIVEMNEVDTKKPLFRSEDEDRAKGLAEDILRKPDLEQFSVFVNSATTEDNERYLSGIRIGELPGDISEGVSELRQIGESFDNEGRMLVKKTGISRLFSKFIGRSVEKAHDIISSRQSSLQGRLESISKKIQSAAVSCSNTARDIENSKGVIIQDIKNSDIALRALQLAIVRAEENISEIESCMKKNPDVAKSIQTAADLEALRNSVERFERRIVSVKRERSLRLMRYSQAGKKAEYFQRQAENLVEVRQTAIPSLAATIRDAHLMNFLQDSNDLSNKVIDVTNSMTVKAAQAASGSLKSVSQSINKPILTIETLEQIYKTHEELNKSLSETEKQAARQRQLNNESSDAMGQKIIDSIRRRHVSNNEHPSGFLSESAGVEHGLSVEEHRAEGVDPDNTVNMSRYR